MCVYCDIFLCPTFRSAYSWTHGRDPVCTLFQHADRGSVNIMIYSHVLFTWFRSAYYWTHGRDPVCTLYQHPDRGSVIIMIYSHVVHLGLLITGHMDGTLYAHCINTLTGEV